MVKHIIHVDESEDYTKLVQEYFKEKLLKDNSSQFFTVGVSGGSMPNTLCPILKRNDPTQLSRIRLFPVDERLVPHDHQDNNVKAYLAHSLPQELSETFVRVEHIDDSKLAVLSFEKSLKNLHPNLNADGFPEFGILFLGLGPDGHTCSLFPGHSLLQETKRWIVPIEDSPKPPPRRVTVTLPVLNAAKNVAFLVTGESKAKVVKEIVEDANKTYPPSLIEREEIHWFLDKSAASLLKKTSNQ
ncbi:glucosamine-6-phosphate isomerases/6-phosphogluconolactonase domain-containing protein [Ditylenchus destructor]|uniref:6-phosphogluconolactonase n=1 Tax=Ditylenchus destructor TaxID=166010 RepID=A0AAD4NCY8_9BILA|nr:glucosamine-6-phosphate isomerases/6-phosphogluconolactonase domain-containing protein [Ditylenchus destructor]